ncbi:MAG: hypothetical protein LBV55_02265 [Acholeplasmatales bacterium]|nr:hypothetical protein [Acholeplasmatales bacterium]
MDQILYAKEYNLMYLDYLQNTFPFFLLIFSAILISESDHGFYLPLMAEFGKNKVIIQRMLVIITLNSLYFFLCLALNFFIETIYTKYFQVSRVYILTVLNLFLDFIILQVILLTIIKDNSKHLIFFFIGAFFVIKILASTDEVVLKNIIFYLAPFSRSVIDQKLIYKPLYLLAWGAISYLRISSLEY